MVRADLLDAIDDVMRRYRNPARPFGGAQLLMIGDLHQLPPVVKPEDRKILSEYYDTPYFFGSRALQQTDYIILVRTGHRLSWETKGSCDLPATYGTEG